LKLGFSGLMTSLTPVMVPPVPTPATSMSILPSVSSHSSTAVVRRWISGLAGFWNCCGMTALGISLRSCSALRIAPFMPSAPGVSTTSAPSALRIIRRSMLIVSGMVRISR